MRSRTANDTAPASPIASTTPNAIIRRAIYDYTKLALSLTRYAALYTGKEFDEMSIFAFDTYLCACIEHIKDAEIEQKKVLQKNKKT